MKSFYEWFNSYHDRSEWDEPPPISIDSFEAGQQSKQAEVDELQKRIDDAVEHIEDYYGVVGLSMIVDILKGDSHES